MVFVWQCIYDNSNIPANALHFTRGKFMRLIILIVFSTVCLYASAADSWQKLSELEEETIFVNHNSIKRNGQYAKAWVMFDYNKPNQTSGKQYKSYKKLSYYDCEKSKVGVASGFYYVGNKGAGKLVNSFDTDRPFFRNIPPGSLAEKIKTFVCSYDAEADQQNQI
jgi:hypothetical protein